MIVANIRALLGDALAGQVEAALKGKGKDGADIDLVSGSDGTYIRSDSHTAVQGRADAAEKTLEAVAAALKNLGASGDAKNLAADVLKVQGSVDDLRKNHSAEMAKLMKTTALKLGLGGIAHDPNDIISRLDLDKIEVDEKGGLKSSLDSLINPIKESKPYLFKDPQKTEFKLSGAVPGQLGGSSPGDIDTAQINAAFGLKGDE